MKTLLILLASVQCMIFLSSCHTGPDYPVEPVIKYIGMSKQEMIQGFNSDTLILTIGFTDGDGDIGLDSQTGQNIFLIDNRTGDIYDRFRIPTIPVEGANNGVSGTIEMTVLTTCCIFPEGIPNCETPEQYPDNDLSFDIYITDRAGHQSNIITTPVIKLLCQ